MAGRKLLSGLALLDLYGLSSGLCFMKSHRDKKDYRLKSTNTFTVMKTSNKKKESQLNG